MPPTRDPGFGKITIVPGSGNPDLASRIAAALGIQPVETRTRSFPDGELDVAVDPAVRNADVYVVQPLGPPVNEHLVELLLLIDACRRAGAARIAAVVPYLGYARNDRRTRQGEAVGLGMVADVLRSTRLDRAIVVDPHVPQVDAIFGIPLEVVSAVPLLAGALAPEIRPDAIVVASDLGAVALAERYADELGVSETGVVRKSRISGREVRVTDVVGDGRQQQAVVVDDMISTGGTIVAAVESIQQLWSVAGLMVAATHALLVEGAVERLDGLPLHKLVISDSLPIPQLPRAAAVVGLAGLLADAVRRLHGEDR